MERGRGGKGEREWWGDHLPYSLPPLASASNTTLVTFPAAKHHQPLAGTKLYCLVTEAHVC